MKKTIIVIKFIPLIMLAIPVILMQAIALVSRDLFEWLDQYCDKLWEKLYRLRDKII
jgi:hypothetical protein